MRYATYLQLLIVPLFAATLPIDPCGPLVQDAVTPKNTCNRPVTHVTAPDAYGALLLNDGSGHEIIWNNCLPVIYDVCTTLNLPSTPVGQWNWTDAGSTCVMGFWLPQYNGSARTPSYQACMDNIYTPMYKIGRDYGGTAYNQVVVNLKLLPNDYQTGAAVDVGYPSYSITYLPLESGPETPLTRG